MNTPATPSSPPPPNAASARPPAGPGEPLTGAEGAEDRDPNEAPPIHPPTGFMNQPWVQNVLPLATSLFLHIGIIVLAIVLIKELPKLTDANKEQVIIPQTSSLEKSKTPGGVEHVGPPADPTRSAAQDQTKQTDDSGFAADPTNKTVAAAGGGDTSASSFLGAASSGGKGHSFGTGAGGGGTAPWGVPGGGEGMLPKSNLMGTGGNANNVIFLCDESGSMVSVFGQLKQELKRSISEMTVDENGAMRFNIIFFSDGKPVPLFSDGMHIATVEAKRQATDFIDGQTSVGGTQPIPAIQMALAEKPELLYVLTDGFDQIADMSTVTNEFKKADADGKIHINCIFLQADEDPKLVAALKEIAEIGHGEMKIILKKDM
jgi:hypothetical protein